MDSASGFEIPKKPASKLSTTSSERKPPYRMRSSCFLSTLPKLAINASESHRASDASLVTLRFSDNIFQKLFKSLISPGSLQATPIIAMSPERAVDCLLRLLLPRRLLRIVVVKAGLVFCSISMMCVTISGAVG